MGHQLGSLSANAAVSLPPTSDDRLSFFFPIRRPLFRPFPCHRSASDALAVSATSETHSHPSILNRKSTSSIRKLPAISSRVEESCSSDVIHESGELLDKPLTADQLTAMLMDSERAKLLRKLSEANQQNRALKRLLRSKEETLASFKRELSSLEVEIQVLVNIAEEISQYGIPEGSRRINGKFIQSQLVSRLEVLHHKVIEEVKGVETALCKEVPVLWYGMAESVIVMGTFDEWSEGEHLSKDYDGSGNTFTAKLMLQPGRYEIKFLVDGEWQLSPEYPLVGDGLTKNNLLLVQ